MPFIKYESSLSIPLSYSEISSSSSLRDTAGQRNIWLFSTSPSVLFHPEVRNTLLEISHIVSDQPAHLLVLTTIVKVLTLPETLQVGLALCVPEYPVLGEYLLALREGVATDLAPQAGVVVAHSTRLEDSAHDELIAYLALLPEQVEVIRLAVGVTIFYHVLAGEGCLAEVTRETVHVPVRIHGNHAASRNVLVAAFARAQSSGGLRLASAALANGAPLVEQHSWSAVKPTCVKYTIYYAGNIGHTVFSGQILVSKYVSQIIKQNWVVPALSDCQLGD